MQNNNSFSICNSVTPKKFLTGKLFDSQNKNEFTPGHFDMNSSIMPFEENPKPKNIIPKGRRKQEK